MYYRSCLGLIVLSSSLTALPRSTQAEGIFQEAVFAQGMMTPSAMEFAPDGRLFVLELAGRVRVIKNGVLLPTPFLTLTLEPISERGLLGIALDPQFASNHFIYLYYTVPSSPAHNRVSRFIANGDGVVPGSETAILDLDDLNAGNHNGGAIHFGLDGKLYIAVGDNANSNNAQSLGTRLGKMLRINSDGSIPSDNPFVATPGARGEIWAYGLRNPFTFAVDPQSGLINVNDVGQDNWEEVNRLTKGANYGWPICEGPQNVGVGMCTSAAFTYPINAYARGGLSSSITGGTFYRGTQFPSLYLGSYFFADYILKFIRRLDTNNELSHFWLAHDPLDMKIGPDGALYYISIFDGNVYRISYNDGTNRLPVAVLSANPTGGPGPLTVSLSASGSSDPDGDTLTCAWTFGDGASGSGAAVSHVYAAPGLYAATLTVSDGKGGSASQSVQIAVGRPPVATILTPAPGTLYNAGDTIFFSGSATDPEDGTLPAGRFSWTVVFHHDIHTHPFLGPLTGKAGGSFQIPAVGEVSANTWYRIHLKVTDSIGLTHEVTHDVIPRKTLLTLRASIPGLFLSWDGQPLPAPLALSNVVGFQREIGAPSPQTLNGVSYVFNSWSDGGAATHLIQGPASDTTYTATYAVAKSAPYRGVLSKVPGTVHAENFDDGGEGLAYHDLDPGNIGGQYRPTGVDITPAVNDTGGYVVAWMQTGEWLNYTVEVAKTASYTLKARVGSGVSTGRMHVEFDGIDKTGVLTVPHTGDYSNWTVLTKPGLRLTAGRQVMRVFIDAEGFNLNYVSLTEEAGGVSTPYRGALSNIPGTIHAENFDEGEEGLAYHDRDEGNIGGHYRPTGVDIKPALNDTGGYAVAWTQTGEWLYYTVQVAKTASYTLKARVGSGVSTGRMHVEFDGVDKTGMLTVPHTGDYSNWTVLTKTGLRLTAGRQGMRIFIDAEGFDLNYVSLTEELPVNTFASLSRDPLNVTFATTVLEGVRAYPNPWRSDRHSGLDMTFDRIPANSTVKIFTVSGRWIKTLTTTTGRTTWNLTNEQGERVASGIYLFLVNGGSGDSEKGKIAVIR